MRSGTARMGALAISMVLVAGCAGDDAQDDGEVNGAVPEEDSEGEPDDEPEDEADDPGEADDAAEDADTDDVVAAAGTVTLNGITVELEEAFWCEDHETEAGTTDMRIVGIAHGMIKLDAGTYTADDGTRDAVAIWQAEELDRGLGGTQLVAVDEGDEGYPWISIDGQDVTIDGSYLGEDDPDDAEEAVFSADVTVEEEPRGDAFC